MLKLASPNWHTGPSATSPQHHSTQEDGIAEACVSITSGTLVRVQPSFPRFSIYQPVDYRHCPRLFASKIISIDPTNTIHSSTRYHSSSPHFTLRNSTDIRHPPVSGFLPLHLIICSSLPHHRSPTLWPPKMPSRLHRAVPLWLNSQLPLPGGYRPNIPTHLR